LIWAQNLLHDSHELTYFEEISAQERLKT